MLTWFKKRQKGRIASLVTCLVVALITGLLWAPVLAQGSGSYFTIDQGLGLVTLWSGGKLNIKSGAELQLDGTALTLSAAELNILDGVTKTASEINALVGGAAGGYRVARGETALDGSNPTGAASGLTTLVACTATLKGTAAPGVGTSVLTGAISSTTFNVYAWKVTASNDATLIASTGTESFYWTCIGT